MFSYCESDSINYFDANGNARKKYTTANYKSNNWITKLISPLIPNVYTNDIKTKVLFNKSFLGVGIKISVGIAAQSNSSGIMGVLLDKNCREISINLGLGKRTTFSCSGGMTWKSFYLKFGISYAPSNSGLFYGISLQISVSYLTALAIAACCVAQPYLSAFMSSAISTISASLPTIAKVLVPMTYKFVYMVI